MRKLSEFLERSSPALVIAVALAMVAAVAVLDTVTGAELAFYVFYFAPVALCGWFAGRWPGLAVAAASAAAWTLSYELAGGHYSSPLVWWWNGLIRLFSFCIVAVLTSALSAEYRHVRALSRIDFLTGLLSKRAFQEAAETERLRCERHERGLSIAYFDLDNFKEVNDSQGHDVGDRLLISVARTLRHVLRRTDVLGRVGGDEFIVLLPETEFAATERVLHKLRDAVAETVEREGWPVTLSIGAAVFPSAGESLDAMVRCADELMYAVKKGGRNAIKLQLVDASALSARNKSS